MRASKTYLHKDQTKKRNSFICSLLFCLLAVLVLVLFRILLFREVVRDPRCIIDVIFHENFCIRVLHIDDLEYHCIRIFFLFRELFFIIFFIFIFFVDFLPTFIIFSFFIFFSLICCSVAVLNSWIILTIHSFVFIRRFRKRRFFQKNYFINDWIWWLMSRVYSLWIIINDDASSTIEIYDLFKTTLLLYFFNGFLSSSFSTYQDIRNVAFEKTNTSLYREAKSFHKLNIINSQQYDDNIDYLLQRIDSNCDAKVCNVDRYLYYKHTHGCQCRSCIKSSRRLLELVTLNIRISFIFSRFWWVNGKHIQ